MRKFLIALSFFTRIKIHVKDVTDDEFFKSMILMPLVGIVIGLWMYPFAWVCYRYNLTMIGAFLMLFAYFIVTGGLHLDGLCDTVDGIMSARNKSRVLEIMKDSRLGSFGAIALLMVFLGNFTGYNYIVDIFPPVVLILPIVGRFCGLQNCFFGTYAEGGGGLGKCITEAVKWYHLLIYIILIAGLTIACVGWGGLIAMGIAMISAAIMLGIFTQKIGGMTGDTIGMTIEVSQTVYLLASAILLCIVPSLFGGYLLIW